jgi:hypothetical protein
MSVPTGASSRFCCPLDEALVECQLVKREGGRRWSFGILFPRTLWRLPRSTGRTKIGCLENETRARFRPGIGRSIWPGDIPPKG